MSYPLLGEETNIGGNRFYDNIFDAEGVPSRNGSVIVDTDKGYCVLEPGEGCTNDSSFIIGAPRIKEKRRGVWVDL